ncbi:hypothetical protein [Komagataeibacter rhaeticus]|uniref:hypothetical protein n=1 Tax=Komagataeibacter rhaeticus TaxID=215221 RepID=UPI001A5CE374|nr:hypothetical protein [Komagataeibacter rhaeticus]
MPRQRADITETGLLLDEVDSEAFIADKACDADALIELLEERQIAAVIPSRKNRRIHRKLTSHSTKREMKSTGSSSD